MGSGGRVVLAGGSGFIGHAVASDLRVAGYEPIILTRSPKPGGEFPSAIWDGETVGDWAGLLSNAAAVINLAGESVTSRWTDENKRRILESRVRSTEVIGKAIRTCSVPPSVWVNSSAVGYYGDREDEELDESSAAGEGFMAEVCSAWERAHEQAETPGVRKARVRIGYVLGKGGGAFEELAKLTKRFLGGAQGNGRQWVPWIHITDLAGIFRWTLESEFSGAVNGVGLHPVRNSELMMAMRRAAQRPWSPPAPGFMIKLAGVVMGVQTDVVLQSQRAKSRVLLDAGFEYGYPTLSEALADLFSP